jgi:hypothetical protein
MSGRDLLDPERRLAAHRARRPAHLVAYEDAVGHVLGRILRGEPVLQGVVAGAPSELSLDVEDDVRQTWSQLRREPAFADDPQTGSVDVRAIALPRTLREEPEWTMHQLLDTSWTVLRTPDALLCALVLAPLLGDLAYVLRLRAGHGPKTAKHRGARLERSRETHRALGLDPIHVDGLLRPELTRAAVVERRHALVENWAVAPADVGERAIALLCGRLAEMYYAKARRDGTAARYKVLTATARPLLEATLGTWSALVAYLGEEAVEADVTPVESPAVLLPDGPPPEVAERLDGLRAWWRAYDARHRAQETGLTSLWGLVPERWDLEVGSEVTDEDDDRHRPRYRELLPSELVARIDQLWGWTLPPRHPDTLVRESHPFGVFAQLLEPAIQVWEDLALTCWYLCFGPYSRRGLDELRDHHAGLRETLAELAAPLPEAVYDELVAVANAHPWLLEDQRGAVVTITLDLGCGEDDFPDEAEDEEGPRDPDSAFRALRAVVDRHRARWIDASLDASLDALWRRDVRAAADAYWERFRARGGKVPTLKQALPDVVDAAARWFGGDYGALARVAALDGPVTASPVRTARLLPDDLDAIRHEVTLALLAHATGIEDEHWERLEAATLAARAVQAALTEWQATGDLPAPKALVGSGAEWITSRLLDRDIHAARELLETEVRAALARRCHPSAGGDPR